MDNRDTTGVLSVYLFDLRVQEEDDLERAGISTATAAFVLSNDRDGSSLREYIIIEILSGGDHTALMRVMALKDARSKLETYTLVERRETKVSMMFDCHCSKFLTSSQLHIISNVLTVSKAIDRVICKQDMKMVCCYPCMI